MTADLRQQAFAWLEDDEPELTPQQIEYNIAASELFQLGAYGRFTYWPSGTGSAPREWLDALHAAQARFETAVLGLVQPLLAQRDQHIAELQDKLCSFDDNGKCCCSFDGPGDVCAVHSPTVKQLRAEVRAQGDALIRARIQLIGRDVENAQLRTERSDFALQVGHYERRWESTVVEARRQAARADAAEAEVAKTRASTGRRRAVLRATAEENSRLRDKLAQARETVRRLNYRAQQAESTVATITRAARDWQFTERGTYMPLRSLAAIARVAGRPVPDGRFELHYQRVEHLQAELDRTRAELATARAQIAPCGNCGHTQAEHDPEHSDCGGSIVKRLDCRCRGYDAVSAPTTT